VQYFLKVGKKTASGIVAPDFPLIETEVYLVVPYVAFDAFLNLPQAA
jgi:hypothetical protein